MGPFGIAVAAALALGGLAAEGGAGRYAEGQVWEYRTRAGDEASLLKIQQIEDPDGAGPAEPIFHLSVINVDLGDAVTPALPHIPVSASTLDASVTRLSTRAGEEFPSAAEGIAEWRRAQGGVFTITVAEIVGITVETLAR